MKEQLVSFETARLVKEKGFGIETEYKFYNEKETSYRNYADWDIREEGGYSIITVPRKTGQLKKDLHIKFIEEEFPAPTQSLLQKWLREVHGIYVESYHDYDPKDKSFQFYTNWGFYQGNPAGGYDEYNDWKTYEEALEFGLKEGLKLIK
jgi:hypothetical protein